MRKSKPTSVFKFETPVTFYMRIENMLGYKRIKLHAYFLDKDFREVGALIETEFGIESYTGEDFWCFKASYTIKKYDYKKETAALNKLYSELDKNKKSKSKNH